MRILSSSTLALFMLSLVVTLAGCEGCDDPVQRVILPGTITGQVCDPGEGVGIFGATVRVIIINETGDEKVYETSTDISGNFLLEKVPVGTHTVYIRRGSFRSQVEDVSVVEDENTELGGECVAPLSVAMAVYGGHDSVEEVLTRLGYGAYTFTDTHHKYSERDENTPSWLVEEFGSLDNFSHFDILFINCGAHEWALEKATDAELSAVFTNLRTFVARGGSLYFSDWAYDIMELIYPDAATWFDDDEVENSAQVGERQDFLGLIEDQDMLTALDKDRVALRYNQSRICMPIELGEGSQALITANNLQVDAPMATLDNVPVLFEYIPPLADADTVGRVIYTTFHNGAQNTLDMDEILRAMIFRL